MKDIYTMGLRRKHFLKDAGLKGIQEERGVFYYEKTASHSLALATLDLTMPPMRAFSSWVMLLLHTPEY